MTTSAGMVPAFEITTPKAKLAGSVMPSDRSRSTDQKSQPTLDCSSAAASHPFRHMPPLHTSPASVSQSFTCAPGLPSLHSCTALPTHTFVTLGPHVLLVVP